ncbi:MAG: hypothetical protein ACOYMW_08065 [Candidatus Competibacteraceae bacterium]
MPRISALPTNTALTGDELIAVVQNGETRQVALSAALIARHPVSLDNARWINSSYENTLLNSPTLDLDLTSSGGC